MSLSRRDFVRLAALVAGAAAANAACSPISERLTRLQAAPTGWPPVAPGEFGRLARLTFGPTGHEWARVAEVGLPGWIEEQLSPMSIEDPGMSVRLRRLDSLRMRADALEGMERAAVVSDLRAATLLRRVYSRRQLYERWVEFWTDHFNISMEKGECWLLKPIDDRAVIRAHAFDRFETLLQASAHSPAMLVYLDNQANRSGAPNENYAREVMELHTLGVAGGYTQSDVMELARCLTGWTVKKHFWKGEFTFDPELHDPGMKTVLDRTVLPGGEREAQEVLGQLASNRATAEHLAVKLVSRFITDEPSEEPAMVARLAAVFRRTKGDLRQVARSLFLDGIARRQDGLPRKIKRPADVAASALRGLAASTDGGTALQDHLAAMGQPLFSWPTPDGPPDRAAPWSGGLMPRWRFAISLGFGEIAGTNFELDEAADPGDTLARLSHRLLGVDPPGAILDALPVGKAGEGSLGRVMAAGLIGAPQFQWR
jgi:uncharacterized protein (DUF1800 family)